MPPVREAIRYRARAKQERIAALQTRRENTERTANSRIGPGRDASRAPPYDSRMALVVFLRGVNVGGYRTFRPSLLARALSKYDVVNLGAAGTFVVRKPGSRAKFRADLLRKLPFEAEVVLCDGRDLIRFETENPFEAEPARADVVRFVSILSKPPASGPRFPSLFRRTGSGRCA